MGLSTSTDSELIIHLLAGARGTWLDRIRHLMTKAEGAYSLSVLTRDAIYGVRDPWGLRPLVLGEIENGLAIASESCAFATIGARALREVEPGEVVRIDHEGYEFFQGAPGRTRAFCTFEQIYFARPDSILGGRLVHRVRQALGRQPGAGGAGGGATSSYRCQTVARPTQSATPRRAASTSAKG